MAPNIMKEVQRVQESWSFVEKNLQNFGIKLFMRSAISVIPAPRA